MDGLQLHHVFGGNANRSMSDKYGLTAYLCLEHHTGSQGVHFNLELREQLQEVAKEIFIERYGEDLFHQEFRGIFICRTYK